jgi:hypothetical protein
MYSWMGERFDDQGRAHGFRMSYDGRQMGWIVEIEPGYYDVFVGAPDVAVQLNDGLTTLTEARNMLQDWARSHD